MASARKIRRRMSVDDANADLLGHVHQTIERLSLLWDQVAMDQMTREKRTESAYTLFYSTMNEIVSNEEEMVKGVFEDIDNDLAYVTAAREELDLKPFPIDRYEPRSIALLKALGKDKKALVERKTQAMARQLEEYNELVKLCRCLGEPIPEFEGIEEKIISKSRLEAMILKRVKSRKELEVRKVKINDLQNKANRRFTVVKNITLNNEERELLSLDLDDPNMVFSSDIIQRFNDLLEKFESEYEKWRETIVFQYLEHYSELAALSEKCYAENYLNTYPDVIDLDIHDESLLNSIQSDLQMLQRRYENGKEIFDIFAKWHKMFKKQEEIEALLNTDKARKNRGGCLTEILRDQKKTNANCERYLKDLRTICDNTQDREVTIEGLNAYQFALHLIQDREQQKENEKELKKLVKAKQLQMESRFGTSAGSPSMKSFNGHESRFVSKSPFVKSPYPKSPSRKSPYRQI